jgi:uncharacterized protein YjbK
MAQEVLNDKSVKPTDDLVFSIIGDKNILWQAIMNHLHNNYEDITEQWNYYNDGKSWLFRTVKKKKTLFWIRVLSDTFNVAFWFPDKAEAVIEQSDLPEDIKQDFRKAKRINMGKSATRCVQVIMKDDNDVENVKKLVELKLKIK